MPQDEKKEACKYFRILTFMRQKTNETLFKLTKRSDKIMFGRFWCNCYDGFTCSKI